MRTFGCQMNANDSDWLARSLKARGFTESGFEEADVHIINTCSVRDKPEQKVYSELGRIALFCGTRGRRDVTVCVGGCVAQQVGARLVRRFPQVRLLFGADGIARAPEAICRLMEEPRLRLSLLDFAEHYEERPPVRHGSFPQGPSGDGELSGRAGSAEGAPASAFVSIMQGCDNFCSYCIVPFVRGRQKSRRPEAVLNECRGLLEAGAREITLLGQNVDSYGCDGAAGEGSPPLGNIQTGFAGLLRDVAVLSGLERLRFITSHPKDISPEVIDAFAELAPLCPRLHLPLQSGSDRILKAMNRRYDTARYLDIARRLKDARPDMALSTDVIVGFPGESEEDFQATMDVMREVGFVSSFSFVYSDRPGTRAASLPGKVDRRVALERLSRLQEWQNQASNEVLASMTGKTVAVLVEGKSRLNTLMEEPAGEDFPDGGEGAVPGEPTFGGIFAKYVAAADVPADAAISPAGGRAHAGPRTDAEGRGESWQGKTPQGYIVNVPLAPRGNGCPDGWKGAVLPVRIEAAARHSLKGRQAGAPW
jgi:tRNA-2-methylthio-N6-dimethylallyladenosine synthase